MKIYKHKAKAYAVLVKAGKYILSEDERENKKQEKKIIYRIVYT